MNTSGSKSNSKTARLLSLLPLFYVAFTRLNGLRAIAYLVSSSFLPGVWLTYRLSGMSMSEAVVQTLVGYVAFFTLYEVGYLGNDTWDAAKSADGRERAGFRSGAAYFAAFVALRVVLWFAVGYWTGWISETVWVAGYGALALVFLAHNVLHSGAYRGATFFQLATLRFVCPILVLIPRSDFVLIVVAALIFYTYLRHLSYLDSKRLLIMPERKGPAFGLIQTVLLAPLVAFLSYAASAVVLLELYVYFLAAYLFWFAVHGDSRAATD